MASIKRTKKVSNVSKDGKLCLNINMNRIDAQVSKLVGCRQK